jgi:hypothetical protein
VAPNPIVPDLDDSARLDQASFEGHAGFGDVDSGTNVVLNEASSENCGFWYLTGPWHRMSQPARLR